MVKQTCLRSVTEFDGLLERRQSVAPTFKLVLMIEDHPALATRLAEMLLAQQADIQVIVASDCLTALKLLRSCTPDLMLVDERLLTHNGIDLTPRLRTMKDLQDIPLLFFSADFP
jgi:DNA-binding response OmpR family regulator